MLSMRKARLLTQTLSPRKVANFAALWTSFHYSRWKGESRHRGNPAKIGFEPTTHCNLRCPECPSGLRSFTRPTGMSDLDLYKSTIDQLQKDLVYLLLYFQGEPYLNPNFLEMAAYAKERGIYAATSTNGHYLNEKKAEETVRSGLSEIIISIDGTTQDTYSAYRVGGNLEKVKQGVKNLVAARKRLKSLQPYIMIQFLVVKPNQHQIEDIKSMGKELGVDKVMFKTAQIYDYQNGSELIPSIEKFSRYKKQKDGSYQIKNKLENQCWKLWHGAEITWDGKVLPCCFDKDAEYEMGSLVENSFEKIWRNPAYDTFRNSLLQSRAEIEICKNCSEGTKVWG